MPQYWKIVKPPVSSVAVVGANGYVGSQISRAIADGGHFRLIPVVRGDSTEELIAQADAVIHAANPAKRFKAEQDPECDFNETVEKTGVLLAAAHGKPFMLVSSLSCRTQLNTGYGRHRRACELMALSTGATVVRLGPMFGGGRTRDVLHDILAGRPVYVSSETRYAYVDVEWVGQELVKLIGTPTTIRELGAANAISLGDLARHFFSVTTFAGKDDTQIPLGVTNGPDASDVIAFAEKEHARLAEWKTLPEEVKTNT